MEQIRNHQCQTGQRIGLPVIKIALFCSHQQGTVFSGNELVHGCLRPGRLGREPKQKRKNCKTLNAHLSKDPPFGFIVYFDGAPEPKSQDLIKVRQT